MCGCSTDWSWPVVWFGFRKRWFRPAGLMFIVFLFSCGQPAFTAEGLTILLMPGGYEGAIQFQPFTKSDCNSLFPHLIFENPEHDWDQLKVGHLHWLCGELEKFARNLNAPLHVRFVGWDEAMTYIDSLREDYDVAQIPSTWTAHFIDKGVLAKCRDVNESEYPPGLLQSCSIGGKKKIYAVPWQSDTRVLYYRKAMTDDPNKLLNFASFKECLRHRSKQKRTLPKDRWEAPFGVSIDRNWDILHNITAYFFSGRILEKRYWRWHPVFHQGEPCKGLKDFWSLVRENLVCFVKAGVNENGTIHGLAEGLLEGQYDAVVGGPHLRAIFESDPNIRAAPLPQIIQGRSYAFLGGCHLGISSAVHKRGNERDAQALVKFLTSYEAQVALYRNTGALPARRDAIKHFVAENPRWKAFGETLEHAKPYPSIQRWAKDVERDAVLTCFYSILLSIQKGEEWSIVESQLKAAARELQPPFPWLIFLLGFSVIAISTALIVVVIRYLIKTKDETADSLADITITIEAISFEPPIIGLNFSASQQKLDSKQISGLTAALLLQGMRNKYVYIPEVLLYQDLYRGEELVIPRRGSARRLLHLNSTRQLIETIENAIGRELNLEVKDREDFVFKWEPQEHGYVCEIDKKKYIESAIIETRKEWINYKDKLTLPKTVELIKKDPGRVAAWHKLANLLAQSNCSDEDLQRFRHELQEQIKILNKMLLRYMGTRYGLTAYLKGYAGAEVDKDWAEKESKQIVDSILTPTEELYEISALLNKNRGMPDNLKEWAPANIRAYNVGQISNLISDTDSNFQYICILAISQHLLDNPDSVDAYENMFKDSSWFRRVVGPLKEDLKNKLREKQRQALIEILYKNRKQFNTDDEQNEYIKGKLNGFVNCFDSITEDEWLNYLWKCLKEILLKWELHKIQENNIILDNEFRDYIISTAFLEDGIVYGLIDPQILEEMMEDLQSREPDEETDRYEDTEEDELH